MSGLQSKRVCGITHVRWLQHLAWLIWIYIMLMSPRPADTDCFYTTIFSLQNADCADRGFTDISKGMDSTIQVLDFSENLVTILDTDEFLPYTKLQEIKLSFNLIETISANALRGLFTLQTLDLESNRLSVIPNDSFRHVTSLRRLNLKGNQISVIHENSFQYLAKIENINLENNFINYIHPKAFQTLDSLYELNLANNELGTLNRELGSFLPDSLEVFRIYKNPWVCDCHLRWLRYWLAESEADVNWHFSSDIPTCGGSPQRATVNWKQLDANQFACAARIVSNSSTSYQVALRGNITIECEVHGDPKPTIKWVKGSREIKGPEGFEPRTVNEAGVQYYVSTLRLMRIQPRDITDYKCIAENYAGRSEVTYKLWVDGFVPPEENYYFEILLGLGVGGLIIIVLLLITLCCLCRKKDRSKREYKVREYRSPNGDRKQIHSPNKHNKDNSKQRINNQPDAQCDRAKLLTGETQLLPDKRKQDINATNTQQPNTQGRFTDNPIQDNQFNMKIFASFDRPQDDITLETDHDRTPDQAQSEADPRGAAHAQGGQNTPDLLKDGGSSMLPSPRAIPVPPPVVPCHLSSALHPRAEENPYVKPSDLRSQTMRRKTASADDLLDSAAKCEDPHLDSRRNSRSRDDLESLSRSEIHCRDIPDYATTSRLKDLRGKDHASTCKNPVCLRDPNLGLDNESDAKGKVRSPTGTPLGLSTAVSREIDVDNMRPPETRAIHPGDSHSYKTLPSRLHKQHSRDQYSPPTMVSQASPTRTRSPLPPSAQRTPGKSRPSHTKTVSFSEQGHPIIDLTQEMPDPIVISSQRRQQPPPPSARGVSDYGTYSAPPRHGYSSTLPQAALRGPVNISGVVPSSHNAPLKMPHQAHKAPLPNGSPARRPPQARVLQSTTLDDLLSPPFGHVSTSVPRGMQGSKTLPHKRKTPPKPGEKDEFGTAV